MKKVIHLIPTMNIGGAETMVKDYALLMNKEIFEVKIISIDKSYHSANEKLLEKAGIPVVHLTELHYSSDRKLNIFQKVIRSLARYYDLYKIITEEKPDIIHAHLYLGNYLKFFSMKKRGIKLLYTVHNVPEHYYDVTGKDKRKYRAYKEIKRLLQKEDLTLIALHDGMNQELRSLFDTENVVTVNNGVNLEKFHKELYNRQEVRTVLGMNENTFLVGHIGRFHEQKNHEFIIRVFEEVYKKNKNAHLLLIGVGELLEKIKAQIQSKNLSECVTILHNRNDIPQLIYAMDVFLFPSKWEGFGNVLIEAQSMGVPCVISDRVPAYAVLNENVSVLTLDTSVEQWADVVLHTGYSDVSDDVKTYDMKSSVKQLERIYLNE